MKDIYKNYLKGRTVEELMGEELKIFWFKESDDHKWVLNTLWYIETQYGEIEFASNDGVNSKNTFRMMYGVPFAFAKTPEEAEKHKNWVKEVIEEDH
jgi:hypothetical protein